MIFFTALKPTNAHATYNYPRVFINPPTYSLAIAPASGIFVRLHLQTAAFVPLESALILSTLYKKMTSHVSQSLMYWTYTTSFNITKETQHYITYPTEFIIFR